jgi:hypothetical protein
MATLDEEKLQAMRALRKALKERQWPENRLKRQGRMTRETLAALQTHHRVPEVQKLLHDLQNNYWRVDSRRWHYFKYKYQHHDPLQSPEELDARFEAVLADPDATIYLLGNRYIIYSQRTGRLAVVNAAGQRITVYRPTAEDLVNLGDPRWRCNDLLA